MYRRLLLMIVLAAGAAFSQGGGPGGSSIGEMDGLGGRGGMGGMGRGGMAGGGMPRAASQRPTKVEQFYEKLKLNKDQKEEAAKILSEMAGNARPLVEEYNKARQQVAMAMLNKSSDTEIKPLMDAYTGICARMTTLEAEAFGKIYAGLKPNQQKNATQAFELIAGVFLPSAGGGRGMGRMGRGGRQ